MWRLRLGLCAQQPWDRHLGMLGSGLWLARGSPLTELRKTPLPLAHILSCFWSSSPVSQPDGRQTSASRQPAPLSTWTPGAHAALQVFLKMFIYFKSARS